MDTKEIVQLAEWLQNHIPETSARFSQLYKTLQHNATQPEKQPVTEHLEALKKALASIPVHQLTGQQLGLLDQLGVAELLGEPGSLFVQGAVERGDFDPATAASTIREAQTAINDVNGKLSAVHKAFDDIGLGDKMLTRDKGQLSIRVQFKDGVAISDVVKWKASATDWHTIARGVALSVGEAPDDVHVEGATTGSIIMMLSGTLAVVTLLALITKKIASMVREVLQIDESIEDLRHKKILNRSIEDALNARKDEILKNRTQEIVEAAAASTSRKLNGEQQTALTKAVEKLVQFTELGGDIDFVAPTDSDTAAEGGQVDQLSSSEISDLRKIIEETRQIKGEIRQLTQQSGD